MFTLTIETDNAAFDQEPASEIVRLLAIVSRQVADGEIRGTLRDVNGNAVGTWSVKP